MARLQQPAWDRLARLRFSSGTAVFHECGCPSTRRQHGCCLARGRKRAGKQKPAGRCHRCSVQHTAGHTDTSADRLACGISSRWRWGARRAEAQQVEAGPQHRVDAAGGGCIARLLATAGRHQPAAAEAPGQVRHRQGCLKEFHHRHIPAVDTTAWRRVHMHRRSTTLLHSVFPASQRRLKHTALDNRDGNPGMAGFRHSWYE